MAARAGLAGLFWPSWRKSKENTAVVFLQIGFLELTKCNLLRQAKSSHVACPNACGTYPLHTWNPSQFSFFPVSRCSKYYATACNCFPQVSVKKSEFFSVVTKPSDRMPIVMTIDVTMSFGRLEGLDSSRTPRRCCKDSPHVPSSPKRPPT